MASTKRKEAAEATRAKVLDVARGLFTRFGFDAVNLRQVASLSGYSTGAIFSNFHSKEELFEVATGRKVPMARVRDALIGAAERGEVPPWGAEGARMLLYDLYGTPE